MSRLSDSMFPIEGGLRDIGNCPWCTKPINMDDFKDDLSRKEFEISGICQKCQDRFFKGEEEDVDL